MSDGQSWQRPTDGGGPGGWFSRNAKWAVPIGTLAAVAAVLICVVIPFPSLAQNLGWSSAAAASPSPSASHTRVTTPPPTASAASSASSSLPPRQVQPSGSATGVSIFDNGATDPSIVSITLALQFKDGGTLYNRESSAAESCTATNQNADVSLALTAYGCTTEIDGTYLDSADQILVVAWVVPLPDKAKAADAYDVLKSVGVDDWGIWCPDLGAGSQVCHEAWQNSTQGEWTPTVTVT